MVSSISPITRDNPEAAMVHTKQVPNWHAPCDEAAAHDEPPARDEHPQFDSAAHRAFMRSLG